MRSPSPALVLLAVASLLAAAPAQGSPAIAATADNRGATLPCSGCGPDRRGGLARRAALLASLRAEHGTLLTVDAGNAFHGRGEAAAKRVRAAYDALGYHAVNLTWRDFHDGAAGLGTFLDGAPFAVVSANLVDEDGEPFAEPFALCQVGGRRVAVLGLSEDPPGRQHLPHLRRQLEGVRVMPPATALRLFLPRAAEAGDDVVLLYYGRSTALPALIEPHRAALTAVVVGGDDPLAVPGQVAGVPCVTAADRGREVGLLVPAEPPESGRLDVDDRYEPVAEIAALVAPPPPPPAPEPEPLPIPASLDLDGRHDLTTSGHNRALRVEARHVGLRRTSGPLQAPEDRALLVVDTVWENTMPGDLVYGMGEGGVVGDLPGSFFGRIGGGTAVRLHPDWQDVDDALPERFELPDIGHRRSGRVVFEIPAHPVRDAVLHFYSERFAPITVRLIGSTTTAEPLQPVQRNEMFALGVFGFEQVEQWAGRTAPPGARYAVVDLRGRSLRTWTTDARALERGAPLDAEAEIGLQVDYQQAHRTVRALVDGRVPRAPRWELGTLDPRPPLFPDVFVGGRAVFLVPEDMRSFDLVCGFAAFRIARVDHAIQPRPMRFPLFGEVPETEDGTVVSATEGDVIQVAVHGRRTAERFAGQDAGEGAHFVIVRVSVRNTGDEPGVYRPLERFRVAGEAPDPLTAEGPRGPAEEMWLPPGEPRAFELVFRRPQAAAAGALAVSTVSSGVQTLATVPAAETTETEESPPSVEPPEPMPGEETEEEPSPAEPPRPPPEPEGLAGVGLTPAEVNRAIDRGRAFLWGRIQEDLGNRPDRFGHHGEHVLAALALVHSNAHEAFPGFDALLRDYLAEARFSRSRTYELACFLMTVDAYGDPGYFDWIAPLAQSLVDGQGQQGTWNYTVPSFRGEHPPKGDGGDGLLEVHRVDDPRGTLKLGEKEKQRGGDNSLAQFAILGLRSARRRGVEVPEEVWQRIGAVYRERQHEDGSWGYETGRGYGSMTCAGICSLALTRWARGVDEPTRDRAIDRGLAWLAGHFSVSGNPENRRYYYYYIYSLERVGRLLDRVFIGRHEWYPLGARALLSRQQEDGSWKQRKDVIVPTSFALLFLTRATEKLEIEEPTGPALLRTELRRPPDTDVYVVLDASGSMLAELGGETKFSAAARALRGILADLPPDADIALRVYGHRKAAIEEGADEDSELILPFTRVASARGPIGAILDALRPRGVTPLAYSLQRARSDLRRKDRRTTVVLLTDGGESARSGRDPVAAAEALGNPEDIDLEILAFDIGRPDWRAQLRAMAAAAGGRVWRADDAASLTVAARACAGAGPESVRVLDDGGGLVAEGGWGEDFELEAGRYRLAFELAGEVCSQEIVLGPGRTVRVVLDVERVRERIASGELKGMSGDR